MHVDGPGIYPYLIVFLSAVIEGEFVFIAACALVTLGQLNGVAVLVCGARRGGW